MKYPDIALWGDSIGRGIDFDAQRGRYAVMRQHGVKLLQERGIVRIDNRCRFGATVTEGLSDFEQSPAVEAGHVAIAYGGNDCNMPWAEVAQQPDVSHSAATPLPQFEETLRAFVKAVRDRGKLPILVTPPPLIAQRFVAWVSQGLNRQAIRRYLGDIQHVYRWQERYDLAVRRVAQTLRCQLFDLRDVLLASDNYPRLCSVDGMHLNELGHLYVANAVEEALPRLVQPAARD